MSHGTLSLKNILIWANMAEGRTKCLKTISEHSIKQIYVVDTNCEKVSNIMLRKTRVVVLCYFFLLYMMIFHKYVI